MNLRIVATLLAAHLAGGFQAAAQIYDTNDDVTEIFAGSGAVGLLNAQGALANFSNPSAVAADSLGNLYVLDAGNQLIRRITTNGTVSTFVGGGSGNLPGSGTSVALPSSMFSMVCDRSNVLWITAISGSSGPGLLHIGKDGLVEFLTYNGVSFNSGLCVDLENNLYYSGANQIYRLGINGTLDVFAGSGSTGSANGQGIYASFTLPKALACDYAGNIYVWDSGNSLIRRIDQNQNVTTIAGNNSGVNSDGIGITASFSTIYAMEADDFGNLFLACGSCIRKIDASTNVWTVAGSFTQNSYANGAGATARFSGATGLCLSQGMIFVADSSNERIRNISFNPAPQQVSGPNLGVATYAGISITGFVGRTYQVQSSPDMTNWTTGASLLLTSSPYLWFDINPVAGNKFYRALLTP